MSRRSWLLAGLSVSLYSARGQGRTTAKPTVTYDGDNIHVAAPPNWHFLTGKPLQRLKDGATVVYIAQLGLYDDAGYQRPFRVAPVDRFAISYDVWGVDRFSVAMPGPAQRKQENLSATATEAWCLDNLAVSTSNIDTQRQFWVKLDMRTADPKDLSSVMAGPGISFAEIILRLGKKAGGDESISLTAGPLRLHDLVRTPGRGSRNG
jgi:hypothetical protein